MIYTEPTQVQAVIRNRIPSEAMLLRLSSMEHGFDVMFMVHWLPEIKSHVAVPTVCIDSCWYSASLRIPGKLYYLIRRQLRTVYGLKHVHCFEPMIERAPAALQTDDVQKQNPTP